VIENSVTAFLIISAFSPYREAVASQSPGLLKPWVLVVIDSNPERVAPAVATALRFDLYNRRPRVAAAATLGFEAEPLCGKSQSFTGH